MPNVLILLTLRGTASLYYGDELALSDGHVPAGRVRDGEQRADK